LLLDTFNKVEQIIRRYTELRSVLGVVPVHPCRAKERTGTLMVIPTIHFDITGKRRCEGLSWRNNPIQYRAFQALCIV
jgi:hypothetical protein